MRSLSILMLISIIVVQASAQDLSFSVAQKKFEIKNDTLLIEKKSGNLSFSIIYTITGTDKPVSLKITEGKSSTSAFSSIVSRLPASVRFNTSDGYSGKVDFNTTMENLSGDQVLELVFHWPDFLKKSQQKEKKLIIKIHKKKKEYDWAPDPTNTPKLEWIQYTDFLGINSDRPNGVIQQQLLFKWPLMKTYLKRSEKFKVQFLRSVLLPNILLNRIDKAKDDSSILAPLGRTIITSPAPDTIANVVGTFDLMRYANTLFGSSLNLLTFHIDKTRLYFNYDVGLLRNRIYDTISQARPVARPIYSILTGWHVYVKSVLDPKTELNIEAEIGANKVHLKDNFFEQYDIYGYDNGPVNSIRFPVKRQGERNNSRPVWYSSVKLSKDWGKESTNYIFFRLKYQWQSGKYNFVYKDAPDEINQQEFNNHFMQVNLGLSLGLEDLFKKK